MTRYLEMNYSRRVIFKLDGRQPQKSVKQFQSMPQTMQHRFCLIAGHLAHDLLDYVHQDTITLTVFRDPIDRIISHYYFVKQNRQHYLHKQVARSKISLEDYVSSGLGEELRNWYTIYFSGLSIKEAEMAPEASVQRAFQVISEKYDIVGFQDDLSAVIQRIITAAHLTEPFQNLVQNKTSKRPKLEEVDENVKKSIAGVNFLDVKLYALLRHAFRTGSQAPRDGRGIAVQR